MLLKTYYKQLFFVYVVKLKPHFHLLAFDTVNTAINLDQNENKAFFFVVYVHFI